MQQRFAVGQSDLSKVEAVQIQQVEGVVAQHGVVIAATVLESLKGESTIGTDGHHLAVEHGAVHGLASKSADQLRIATLIRLAAARPQMHATIVDKGEHAVAIQLRLVQPVAALEDVLGERRQHRLVRLRKRGAPGALQELSALGRSPTACGIGHADRL